MSKSEPPLEWPVPPTTRPTYPTSNNDTNDHANDNQDQDEDDVVVNDPDPFPRAANPNHVEDAELEVMNEWWRRNAHEWTSIPWERYARPPILSPLWFYSMDEHRLRTFYYLSAYMNMAGRRLSATERDALLDAVTRNLAAKSYIHPIVMVGMGWAMRASWVKSRAQAQARRTAEAAKAAAEAAAAAAAAASASTTAGGAGVGAGLGGAGHITYFSQPSSARHPAPTTATVVASSLFSHSKTTAWRVARVFGAGMTAVVVGTVGFGFVCKEYLDAELTTMLHNDERLWKVSEAVSKAVETHGEPTGDRQRRLFTKRGERE